MPLFLHRLSTFVIILLFPVEYIVISDNDLSRLYIVLFCMIIL